LNNPKGIVLRIKGRLEGDSQRESCQVLIDAEWQWICLHHKCWSKIQILSKLTTKVRNNQSTLTSRPQSSLQV